MDLPVENVELYGLMPNVTYNIQSEFTSNYSLVALPPVIKHTKENLKKRLLMKQNIYLEIVKFRDTIKSKMTHYNLSTFYLNVSKLKVRNYDNIKGQNVRKYRAINGGYSYKHNTIEIYGSNLSLILPHELFHLSNSHLAENGITYSGFCQSNSQTNEEIGRAINEGYTALINKRYFPETTANYELYSEIMSLVEEEIGQEKMEKLYSEMNLLGLLSEVKQSGFYEQFVSIIKCTDYFELAFAEKTNPLRYFKPQYEKMTQEEREKIIIEEGEKQDILEKKLIEELEKMLIVLARNKIKRKEMTIDEATNWVYNKHNNLKFLNSQRSLFHFFIDMKPQFEVMNTVLNEIDNDKKRRGEM